MYRILTESINVARQQFNRGTRSIVVFKDGQAPYLVDGDPIYATVKLPAEGDSWEGQSKIEIKIHARPGSPVDIFPDCSTEITYPGSYGPDEDLKREAMRKRLDELCNQAEEWVKTFLYTKPARDR